MGKRVSVVTKNKYQEPSSLKKNGHNLWRFVFTGVERGTGKEKTFYIELSFLNPYVSPKECVFGLSPLNEDKTLIPSYVAVRAGVISDKSRHLCQYFPIKNINVSNHSFDIEAGLCHFTEGRLTGSIECTKEKVSFHPELLSDTGLMSWELQYECKYDFDKLYKSKEQSWVPYGARTIFAGIVTLDGKEYAVIPKRSFGYVEKSWGRKLPENWVHISSSNLSSLITGKILEDSCFVVHGDYDGSINLFLNIEGTVLKFTADSFKFLTKSQWECSQTPDDGDGERLHWSVSVNNRNYLIDLDVVCLASLLNVRSWELPEGSRKVLRVIGGGEGSGELRVYKRLGRNLELLHHEHISNAICEYGQEETQD